MHVLQDTNEARHLRHPQQLRTAQEQLILMLFLPRVC